MTRRQLPDGGEVVYIGTGIDPEFLVPLATATLDRQGIVSPIRASTLGPPSLETIVRKDREGNHWTIRINYATEHVELPSGGSIPP